MGKILLWIVVILVVLTVARIASRATAARQARGANPRARRPAAPVEKPAEAMVRCAHCGIHLPRSEAVQLGGNTWCSSEHARLGVPTKS